MVKFGFEKIDSLLENNGLKPGTVSIVGGNSACGKTNFLIKIMNNNLRNGKNVCFLTCDDTERTIINRSLAELNGFNLDEFDFLTNNTNIDDLNIGKGIVKQFKDEIGSNISDVKNLLNKSEIKYDLVIVDIQWSKDEFSELIELAKELNICFINSKQANRDCTVEFENLSITNGILDSKNVQSCVMFDRNDLTQVKVLKSDITKDR